MESKISLTTAEPEDNSFALTSRVTSELPKLHHGTDDAEFIKWLNTLLQNKVAE